MKEKSEELQEELKKAETSSIINVNKEDYDEITLSRTKTGNVPQQAKKTGKKTDLKSTLDNVLGDVQSAMDDEKKYPGKKAHAPKIRIGAPAAPPTRAELEQMADEKWQSQYKTTSDFPGVFRYIPSSGAKYKVNLNGQVLNFDAMGSAFYTVFEVGNDENEWTGAYEKERVEIKVDLNELKSMNDAKLSDMWKDYYPDRAGYIPDASDLQGIRRSVLEEALSRSGKTMKDYNDTLVAGDDTGATFKFLKDIGAWDMYYKIDLTKRYLVYTKEKKEFITRSLEAIKRPEVTGESNLNLNSYSYETQGTQNCFACSFSALYNHYVDSDPALKTQKLPRLNQEKVRSFSPRYLGSHEIKNKTPEEAKEFVKLAREAVGKYAGPGKKSAGNLMEISDILFENEKNGGVGRSDLALVKKAYAMGRLNKGGNETIKENIFKDIKKQIHKGLDSGQMVSVLAHGHYMTVVALKDNEVTYLESSSSTPTIPRTLSVEDFIMGGTAVYKDVEVNFLRKLTPADKDQLKNEYHGFGIDEKTGEVIRTNSVIEETDAAHRMGIVIAKDENEIHAQGDGDISNYIGEYICLSKNSFMTERQKRAFNKKVNDGWNAAQDEWDAELEKKAEEKEQRDAAEKLAREEAEKEKKEREKILAKAALELEALKKKEALFKNVFEKKEKKDFFKVNELHVSNRYKNTYKKNISKEDKEGYLKAFRLFSTLNPKMRPSDANRSLNSLISVGGENTSAESKEEGINIIEQLFVNIMETDLESLKAVLYDEMSEKLNTYSPLFDLAEDENNPVIKAYEKMTAEGKIHGINSAGIEEVKKRLSVIREYGEIYRLNMEMKRDHEETRLRLRGEKKDIDSLSEEEIMAELSKKQSADVLNYYSKGLSLKLKDKELKEKLKGELSPRRRENLVKALKDRVREYSDKKELKAKYFDAAMAYEQYMGYTDRRMTMALGTDKNLNRRLSKLALVASSLNKEDDVLALNMYYVLKKGAPKANTSKADKQNFIDVFESLAGALLKVDLSIFKAANGLEFFADRNRYGSCLRIIELSNELKKLLPAYDALRQAEGFSLCLDEEKLQELSSRADALSNAEKALEEYQKIDGEPDTSALDFDKGKTDEILKALDIKNREKLEREKQRSWEALVSHAAEVQENGAVISVSKDMLYGYASSHNLRANITQLDREKKMKNKRSALYKKVNQAKAIEDAAKVFRGSIAKQRRRLSFSVTSLLKEEEFKALSAFFGENAIENSASVRSLAKNRHSEMSRITEKFLNLSINGIDFSSDDKLIESGTRLEELTEKVKAYQMLLDKDAEFCDSLKTAGVVGGNTLYDMVQKKMKELTAVTDFYRARKLLITNPYYMSHYNDELSFTYKNSDLGEQQETSRLMLLSIECAKRLKAVLGDRVAGNAIDHPDLLASLQGRNNMTKCAHAIQNMSDLDEGISAELSSMEEIHKVRRYADGRLDASRITSENLDAFLKEFTDMKAKGAYSLSDMKDKTPNMKKVMREASPAVREALRYWVINSSTVSKPEERFGETYTNLHDIALCGPKSRLKSFSTSLEFKNPHTGRSLQIGADMNRLWDVFLRIAISDGMSDEEINELFEGMNIGQWKDLDTDNEEQMKAAEDRYLKSIAKLYKLHYEHHIRYIRTYGMLPDQIPGPLMAIAAPEAFGEMRLRIDGGTLDELAKNGGVMAAGHEKELMLDYLVENNYITADFAAEYRRITDHLAGTHIIISCEVSDVCTYAALGNYDEDTEKVKFSTMGDFYSSVSRHISDYEGWDVPKLSREKEKDVWKVLRRSTTIAKDSLKEREQDSISRLDEASAEVKALRELNTYISALNGVETRGHSGKYFVMTSKISVLRNYITNLSRNHRPDGKNVSPNDLIVLRGMYQDVIKASTTYLRGKNREHKNELYRRRYDIVEDMINTLTGDLNVLKDQMFDRSYNLNEVLTAARTETITVDAKNVKKHAGGMSQRQAFKANINGEEKKMAFTKRTVLQSPSLLKNRYTEFSSSTKKDAAFPELAYIAGTMNREYMDTFFKIPSVAEHLKKKNRGKYTKETYAIAHDSFARDVEKYFGALWERHKAEFNKANPNMFPIKSGNIILGKYNALTRAQKKNVILHLENIGAEYVYDRGRVNAHNVAGIDIGDNLDKRNVAMTILAKELDSKDRIAYSELASVKINEEGKENKAEDGILMEWVEGYTTNDVRRALNKGEIECDNEAEIIEQLSDLQIIDYISGNVDRHMGNVMMRMQKTGRKNHRDKDILRIVQIVGIDNDMSFGKKNAKDVGEYISRLTPPECMQIMSRRMADRVLNMDKDRIFLLLGSTITEAEKESMWSRVQYLQLFIKNAGTEGQKGNLRILEKDDFKKMTLKELARSNHEPENIYRSFYEGSGFGRNVEENDPCRYACEEQRIELKMGEKVEVLGHTYAMDEGAILDEVYMSLSREERDYVISQPGGGFKVFSAIMTANGEFNRQIASLFSKVSSSGDYGFTGAKGETADLFRNDVSKAKGINSIIDIFYIDGKPAREVIPQDVPRLIEMFKADAEVKPLVKGASDEAITDMIHKAFIMSYISMGEHQVTIANYQKNREGNEDLVITDLNPCAYTLLSEGLPKNVQCREWLGESKLAKKSRKNRAKRFAAIRQHLGA